MNCGQAPDSSRDQYTLEAFYRYDKTDFLQLTPEIQYIIDPANDPATSDILVVGLRLRIFFWNGFSRPDSDSRRPDRGGEIDIRRGFRRQRPILPRLPALAGDALLDGGRLLLTQAGQCRVCVGRLPAARTQLAHRRGFRGRRHGRQQAVADGIGTGRAWPAAGNKARQPLIAEPVLNTVAMLVLPTGSRRRGADAARDPAAAPAGSRCPAWVILRAWTGAARPPEEKHRPERPR